MATVVLLVVLRLALGWHFLYEGVWKIKHADEFLGEAEMFLIGARGPLAPMFRAMLPDVDGRQRLQPDAEPEKNAKGKLVVKNELLANRWEAARAKFVEFYRPRKGADAELEAQHEKLAASSEEVYKKHLADAEEYLAANWDEIQAHYASLDRFNSPDRSNPNTSFQRKRNREDNQKLGVEVKGWLTELNVREKAYKAALIDLVDKEQQTGRDPFARSYCPFAWSRNEQIAFAITFALSGIGLCLMLGLFTRPAALGGALFMMAVVMSQPSYPGVVPPDPPQLGHALLVNKDFIEMVALFLIATTAVGRWGGLDYFLHTIIIDPFLSKTIYRNKKEGQQA